MEAAEAIALVKGHVEHELLLRNEYLAAENEILRSRIEVRTCGRRREGAFRRQVPQAVSRKERSTGGSRRNPSRLMTPTGSEAAWADPRAPMPPAWA